MQGSDPRIRSLLWQAQRVTAAGKRTAAEKMYRQIIEEAPDTAEAWIGLGNILLNPVEQEEAYQQALLIEPDNRTARKALAALTGSHAPGARSVDGGIELSPSFDATESWAELESARDWYDEVLNPKSKTAAKPANIDQVTTLAPDSPVKQSHQATPKDEDEDEEVADEALACVNHPKAQTSLRCNKCSKPICVRCAITTPVGYRCPQCIREREDIFYTATPLDYLIAAVSSLILSVLAGAIVPYFGFFVLFIAALAGSLIGRTVFRLVGRRRGRWLPHMVATAVVLGALPAFLATTWWIWPAVYLFIATGAAYYQMK